MYSKLVLNDIYHKLKIYVIYYVMLYKSYKIFCQKKSYKIYILNAYNIILGMEC